MTLRWFFSSTVRQATDLRRRVKRLVHEQRDWLTGQGIDAVEKAGAELHARIHSGAGKVELQAAMEALGRAADKWLKPYPHASFRENTDVVLVAMVVALAIQTFFFKPMAIPTGSMQPTLYGITVENLAGQPDVKIPGFLARVTQSWFRGVSYYHLVAKASGELQVEPPRQLFPLVGKQSFRVGGVRDTLWFPRGTMPELPGVPPELLTFAHGGALPGRVFKQGEDILKLRVRSGDRLFVNRLAYNFRKPRRGEIVIFASTGIPRLTQDTHYIKRLVGLPGEALRIGNDRHVIVNGRRLDAATPHFENIYGFSGPARDNHYSGHVNGATAQQFGRNIPDPLFPDESATVTVGPRRFLVMGDNTMNSYDSRYWGDFPQEKVIGKCAFVFWPISPRFGWGFR